MGCAALISPWEFRLNRPRTFWFTLSIDFDVVGRHTTSIEKRRPPLTSNLTDLIQRATWREAVTYRDTWPHEYVLSEKDSQQELLTEVCNRFRAGEGVSCRFFRMKNTYLFVGDHKYWLMTHWDDIESGVNYVINRAKLYRDRRDFVIQPGDTGRPEDYPSTPALPSE